MSRRELTPRGNQPGLPSMPSLTDIPDALYGAILQVEDPAVPHTNLIFPSKIRDIAGEYLRSLAPLLAPASRQIIALWFMPIVAAAPNQRDQSQIPAWTEAVMLAMVDVPTGAFSIQNQRAALRTLTFFPSPADLWKIIEDDVRRLRRREETLKVIVGSSNG